MAMSSLENNIKRTVERHFKNHNKECEFLVRMREEIAERRHRAIDSIPNRNAGPGDPTGNAVVQMDERYGRKAGWVKVIRKTLDRYQDELTGRILTERYLKGLRTPAVCAKLYVSDGVYYGHLNKGLVFAAMLAVQAGLLTVDEDEDGSEE